MTKTAKQRLLKLKNDPNCVGITYRIPWTNLVYGDKEKISNLLCSPGYSKKDVDTHANIESILGKYEL